MIDDSKLSEDFFTKSSQGSPAIIFQKLIFYVSLFSNHDPIKAMVLLGGGVTFFYIPCFFLITQNGLKNIVLQMPINEHSKKIMLTVSLGITFILFIFIILIQKEVNNRFTNMMWPPILLNPNAYIVSMLLCIGGALISITNIKYCVILIIFSCLIHPAMCLFTAIFCFLLLNNFNSKWKTLKNGLIFFIPILLVYISMVIYYPQTGMSAHDFIEIYIYQRHPHHYLISASFQYKQWIMILLILFAETVMLLLLKNKLWINSLLALILLIILPQIHYLFTEIYQNKTIAILGFTRFFTFAFFLIVFFGLAAFISLFHYLNQHWRLINKLNYRFERFTINYNIIHFGTTILLIVATVLLLNYIHRELIFTNHSINEFNKKYQDILYKIPDSSVVMMLDEDDFHFGLFGKKNLYSTEAFPFSESKFYEYAKRRIIIDNCNKNLSLNSLNEAKNNFKLNYLLMNRERLSNLPGANPIGENDNMVLIDVEEYLRNAKQPLRKF